jgi:hypothetical protein
MKRIAIIMVLLGLAATLAQPADAKPRGNFGLGIIVGEPTGIDMKWFLNDENAIEAAVAWSTSGNSAVHIQADYLFHFYEWIKVSKGMLPVFFGIGGRFAFVDEGDNSLGIRIPVGLDYEFAGGVVDVFGELVPVLELTPDTDFELEGAIGVRFWF